VIQDGEKIIFYCPGTTFKNPEVNRAAQKGAIKARYFLQTKNQPN